MTLIALLQARNEERFLLGWLESIGPIVDAIVALDDGSTDRTQELLRAHPKVVELIQNPVGAEWDERANQVALVKAGRRHGGSWFLCIDADERLEAAFTSRAKRLLEEGEQEGIVAYCFQLRELWGDRSHYRVDGIWRDKTRYRLFRNNPSHRRFDPRKLHRYWMPLEVVGELTSASRHSEHNLYHLKMVHPADRVARVQKYEAIDPDHLWQKIGYRYLIDETGLELEQIPSGRDFLPLDDPAV